METLGVKEKEHIQEQVEELKEEQAVTKEELLNPSNDTRRSCSSAKSDEEQAGTKDYELLKPSNAIRRSCSSAKSDDKEEEEEEDEEEVGPRERIKRHRREVAGKVGIPDRWGQECFLQEWIDCTAFDASLLNPHNILLARASLIRQQSSTLPLPLPLPSLPLENSC